MSRPHRLQSPVQLAPRPTTLRRFEGPPHVDFTRGCTSQEDYKLYGKQSGIPRGVVVSLPRNPTRSGKDFPVTSYPCPLPPVSSGHF